MSTIAQSKSGVDQPAMSDESLLAAHEKILGKQPDEKARYRLLPLNLLFMFSGLIFFGGTYLGRYAGHFDARIYNENMKRGSAVVAAAPVNPLVAGERACNNA